MDQQINVDFIFGDLENDIKKIELSDLKNFKYLAPFKRIPFTPLTFQKRVINLLFKPYNNYILTGEFWCLSNWILLILAKFSRHKLTYVHTHGWYGKESFSRRLLLKIFYGLADGILLYGEHAKDLMLKNGFAPNKLHVIYNNLNYDEHLIIRKDLTKTKIYKNYFHNENPNLCFVGRLKANKKLNLVVSALYHLKQKGHEINLTFIGDGDEKDGLENLCQELGIKENVWFFGACYDENILAQLFYNADLCVSPGNVGLTAIHAMTYGCPVITHNNFPYQMPEFEAIKEGLTGTFFRHGDIESLSNKIFEWLKSNKEKRNDIRSSCFKVIDEKYNPHYQISILKEILK